MWPHYILIVFTMIVCMVTATASCVLCYGVTQFAVALLITAHSIWVKLGKSDMSALLSCNYCFVT